MRRHPWLTAAIVLVVLLGVVHFCLEWRAEQRWQRYAAAARARGVKLMLADFAQPEIPDAQNFAMLPMMQKAFGGKTSKDQGFKLPFKTIDGFYIGFDEDRGPPDFGDPKRGEGPRWAAIAQSFWENDPKPSLSGDPVRDVLARLERFTPELQQWSEWRQRPQCRFPARFYVMSYDEDAVLKTFSNAAHFFALRMHAHLAQGDTVAAAGDFQEGMQAYHELREEPPMAAGCHRLAILQVMIDAVADGLRRRAWDASQLQAVQAEIETIRMWDDYRFALSSERAAMNSRVEMLANASMRERGRIQAHYLPPRPALGEFIGEALPRRVFRNVQWEQNQYFDELLARVDPAKPNIDFDGATPSSFQLNPTDLRLRLWELSCVDIADYTRIERSYAARQTLLDQARLACALERYRLARGTYPATLTELVPQFISDLPRDPYARAPYHYQRADGGTFLLYGVGVNRQDDGGQINPSASEREQLDAIWFYAPPATP